MTGQQLKNSILHEAIQGRLAPNVLQPGEKTGAELLQDILAERQKKENAEKGKKAKKLTLSTIEEEPWELPEGWCWCKLGDLGEFTRGNGIKKDDVLPDGYPCIRYGELYTRYRIQFSTIFSKVSESTFNKSQKIESGDIVMALTGENEYDIALASVYLGKMPVAMGGDMTKLHPYVDSKYLVYAINSPYGIECKSVLATGQIIVHISNDKLASIHIPLPPISIQKAIVEKIEELIPLVDEYDKAAGELKVLNESLPDKLRKSVLHEAIHGTLVPNDIPEGESTAQELLQQILKERQDRENKEKGKKAKKLTLSEIEEGPWELPEGWCWCRLGDIVMNRDSERVPLSVEVRSRQQNRQYDYYGPGGAFDKVEGFLFSKRLLLIGEDGANLLTRSKPNAFFADGKYWVNNHVHVLDSWLSDSIILDYIALRVNGMSLADYVTGTAQPKMNQEKMNSITIPLPPLSIQHRIVEKIEELFSMINVVE